MGFNTRVKGKWRAAAGMLAFLMALPTLAGLLKFESKAATSIDFGGQTRTYGYYLSDGTQVTETDDWNIWYDDATGNVTLRNANIIPHSNTWYAPLSIYGGGTLTILGTNTLDGTSPASDTGGVIDRYGIHIHGNYTIEGTGTLNLIGANNTTYVHKSGINCGGTGKLTIQGDVTINTTAIRGIYAKELTIGGNAKVYATGTGTSTTDSAIEFIDSLTIKDNCVVEAKGNNYGLFNNHYDGTANFLNISGFSKIILEGVNGAAGSSQTVGDAYVNIPIDYAYKDDAGVYTKSNTGNFNFFNNSSKYLELLHLYPLTVQDSDTSLVSAASSANDTLYYEGETVTLTQGTPNAGYEFNGWTSNEVTGITGDSFAMPAQNTTVTANWSIVDYGITYHLDGGTVQGTANPAAYNVTTTDITLNNPTKEHYTFEGWYTDAGLQNPATAPQIPLGSTGNKEFYAKFTPTEYNITYHLDGGTELTNPATYNVETAVTLNSPTKTGYTFDGWYTDATLQNPATAPQIPTGSTGAKEFWAKYTPIEYNIDYQMNGGGDKGTNPTTYNITDVIVLAAAGIRDGYNFEGWFSDNNTFNNKVEQIGPNESGNKTLYAKWKYAGNINIDGTETPVIEDEVITLPTPSPVPDGYEFERWEVTPDKYTGNITDPTNPNSTFTVPGEYVSLTPKWTPIEYTITYNVGEGKNAASNPASYNIESETITLAEPTITGFYFGGWYTDAEYKNPVARIEKGSMGNRTLYAKWDEYKIIMGQGGIHQLKSGGTLSFTATGHFKDFTEVLVDSAVIDGNSYSAAEGSTVVTLTTEYLDTLSVGTHSITVRYNNGEASTTFEVQAAPLQGGGEQAPTGGTTATGGTTTGGTYGTGTNVVIFTETGTGYRAPKTFDETSIMLMGGAAAAAAVSLIGMAIVIKKRRAYKE